MEQRPQFADGRTQARTGYVAVALLSMHDTWMRTIAEVMSATGQEAGQ